MRNPIRFIASATLVLLAALWAQTPALAASEGRTAQGEAYASGGIAAGEREAMDKRRANFNFWLVTAAKKTGSYLADAKVRITDAAGKTVLDTRLDGPWLLANLKLGKYKVEATVGKQTQSKATTIHQGDHHEMMFYFDVEVETLPKGAKE